MSTLLHIFAAYGFCCFLGLLSIIVVYGPRTYRFIRAEFFPVWLIWWQTKGAAIVVHQLGLWLFFAGLFGVAYLLDANGFIWFY